jgi:hypothetical protein
MAQVVVDQPGRPTASPIVPREGGVPATPEIT